MALTITGPLWGSVFADLLRSLLPVATRAGLVSETERTPGDWLSRAQHIQLDVREQREWPGTVSLDPVTVYTFAYGAEFVDLLWSQGKNLFKLQEHNLPDDLHCFDADGRVILGSTSCIRDAWTDLTLDEWSNLIEGWPRLSRLRTADRSP